MTFRSPHFMQDTIIVVNKSIAFKIFLFHYVYFTALLSCIRKQRNKIFGRIRRRQQHRHIRVVLRSMGYYSDLKKTKQKKSKSLFENLLFVYTPILCIQPLGEGVQNFKCKNFFPFFLSSQILPRKFCWKVLEKNHACVSEPTPINSNRNGPWDVLF